MKVNLSKQVMESVSSTTESMSTQHHADIDRLHQLLFQSAEVIATIRSAEVDKSRLNDQFYLVGKGLNERVTREGDEILSKLDRLSELTDRSWERYSVLSKEIDELNDHFLYGGRQV